MTFAPWIWQVLNWLSLPVVVLLAGIMVWRKLHRVFPLFFAFLVVTEITGIIRLIASEFGSSSTYSNVYWITDLAWMISNFLAVYELFIVRLFPKFHKVRVLRRLFALVAIAIISIGWVTAFGSSHRGAWFAIEARVLSFVLVAMLIFFVSLMMIMGRHWTKYDFGIAFGFAINNAAVLATSAAWVRSRYHSTIVNQLPLLAFDLSCLLWLGCFWSTDKSSERLDATLVEPTILREARTWESMLKTWLTPSKK